MRRGKEDHYRAARPLLIGSSLCSQAPRAVDAWKADLTAKSRPKLAESIAHPDFNTDLFEEGWADAVAKEQGKAPEAAPLNGQSFLLTQTGSLG